MRRVLAVLLVLQGVALTALPTWLLPVCSYASISPPPEVRAMHCHTSSTLLVALGVLATAAGVCALLGPTGPLKRRAFASAGALAALAAGVVTGWPGVCAGPHVCRVGTLPGTMVLAALMAATALAGWSSVHNGRR